MSNFDVFLDALSGDEFEEHPATLQEFLYGDEYLGFASANIVISEYQTKLLEAMTTIYRYDTLVELWGYEEADRLNKADAREIIMQLGKGSGKDMTTAIGFAYIAHLLLCLEDPAKYYGKPPGDAIHLLNIAINATQAKNVFFEGFKTRVKRCPWFEGKFHPKAESIEFIKGVSAHSGHSDREAWEGYNLLVVVLDEISGFSTESETSGSREGKTANAIHKMYRESVVSRFPQNGKIALLSFPRYRGDYIQEVYDKAVLDKEVETKSYTFKLHSDLADGVPGNEFTIDWEIDHIVSYTRPGVFALRRPSWDVNPTKTIEDYKLSFFQDPQDSKGRFACMPADAVDAFFKDKASIERAFPEHIRGPFDDQWRFLESLKPNKSASYYLHVDLGYTHDRAAVAMAHIVDWVWMDYGGGEKVPSPIIKIDAVRWWTPTSDKSVNFQEIEDFIVSLKRLGFNIVEVTFDRWSSVQFRQQLENNFGIGTDMVSVGKPHYEDFAGAVYDSRIRGYNIPLARDEFVQLQIIKGNKVDHPRKSCFVGSTRIPLLDGTRPEIKDLVGKEVWVYSAKPDGTIVPGRAFGKRTKQTRALVDVELDNGYIARCTPDHRWMLRNGKYKEAINLRPGVDRLMPINFFWPHNGGYEAISGIAPGQERKESTHRVVASFLAGRSIEEYEVVHHLDHNKANNHPENLQIITREEHSRHHTDERHATDESYRHALSEGTARFNRLPSTRIKRSESMKSRTPEWFMERARKNKNFRSDITIDSLLAIVEDSEATNANMASKILGCGRNVVVRVLREHGYQTWEEFRTGAGANHRVRSITPVGLDEAEWVYDLEVDEWSNFALTGGVFVHNSKDVADAIVGAVYGCIIHGEPQVDNLVTVRYLGVQDDDEDDVPIKGKPKKEAKEMPPELAEFINNIEVV